MAERDFGAGDKQVLRSEAEKIDLEMHARLEAGLLDSDLKSAPKQTPAIRGPAKPSLWEALKRFFH